MAEIKSESVADFIPESVADLLRNQHCRRIALRFKAGESLAAEFVERLNRVAEIGAAVDPIS